MKETGRCQANGDGLTHDNGAAGSSRVGANRAKRISLSSVVGWPEQVTAAHYW